MDASAYPVFVTRVKPASLTPRVLKDNERILISARVSYTKFIRVRNTGGVIVPLILGVSCNISEYRMHDANAK